MLDVSFKKSNYNSTSELSRANWGTNDKQRMTNWQQVLRGESSLAAFYVCTSALQNSNPRLYLGRFLKTICGVFHSVEGRSSTAARKHGSVVPNPRRAFVASPSKVLGWLPATEPPADCDCPPKLLCTLNLRLAAVTHISRRRIWGPHGIHVNTAAQPIRGSIEGVTDVSEQGRAGPKRCVSISDPCP